jgi:hypothetical protein
MNCGVTPTGGSTYRTIDWPAAAKFLLMAHTLSERGLRRRTADFAPEHLREQKRRSRQEILHAKRLVDLWNKRARRGRRTSFYQTVDAALTARCPVLDVLVL